jgi:hypothetical protein
MLAMTSKLFPIIWMENQNLSMDMEFIDDWTLVTGSYDDGCPEAWEQQTMSDDKKHLVRKQWLVVSGLYSFTDGM